jgi:hypothetical protein
LRWTDVKENLNEWLWKKTATRVAVIGACGTILAAVIGGVVTLTKKDPPVQKESSTATNTGTTVNVQSPPVNIATTVNVQPQAPITKPTGARNLVLEQFTINKEDSLYDLCESIDSCEPPSWKGTLTTWYPKPEWQAVVAAQDSPSFVKEVAEQNQGAQGKAFQNYEKDPAYYQDRMNPVFDAVISNHGQDVAVLTGIDVVLYRSEPYAQGDGEDSAQSKIIPVLNRYTIMLKVSGDEDRRLPYSFRRPAVPPISVVPNRPARFQVEMVCKTPVEWNFEMQVRFHFGPGFLLKTEKFRLTC